MQAPPPVGADDHVRGSGIEAIAYFDLSCPKCVLAWVEIRDLPLRLCVRHFPLASKRPRAPALHAAAEAAGMQRREAFWEMWDAIYLDQARQDDPHLWERARRFGLDLDRFERDRRSGAVAARVRRDYELGLGAGVVATPAAFVAGEQIGERVADRLVELAGA